MKAVKKCHFAFVVMATFGVAVPNLSSGETFRIAREAPLGRIAPGSGITGRNLVSDVAIARGGRLHGRIVDSEGTACQARRLLLRKDGRAVAECISGDQGQFVVEGLSGGTYQVESSSSGGVYRVWAPGTAPPCAKPEIILIEGPVIRGQYTAARVRGARPYWNAAMPRYERLGCTVLRSLSHPWIVMPVVTSAVAIPLALTNDNPSGS